MTHFAVSLTHIMEGTSLTSRNYYSPPSGDTVLVKGKPCGSELLDIVCPNILFHWDQSLTGVGRNSKCPDFH